MRIKCQSAASTDRRESAFSFIELLMAVTVTGIVFVGLYAGFSAGFAVVQLSRENLRGTQILQEKLETIRLYNWSQVTNVGFVPTTFVESFYPGTQSLAGISYTGTVSIAASGISETYASQLRLVTVRVSWVSAKILRRREMATFVSEYGLQNYIYR